MFNISGLNTLLRIVRETGIKPTKLHILSGVSKARHGLWIITHKGLVEEEGYGITSLVDYNIKEAKMFTDETVCKYIGLTEGQQECCVFGIEAGEDEVIKMKTSLNTKVGVRQICGEGCEDHDHKPLVTIKPVVENKDANTDTELSEQDTGESGDGDGESGNSGSDGDSETLSEQSTSDELSDEPSDSGNSDSTVEESTEVETKKTDSNLNPEIEPNFEYAQSLSGTGNKNEQKLALEEYARRFNIELNRGTKFDAMMADFKEKASA